MQTNANKTRIYRNEDKIRREDPKRDKFGSKEQRRQARRTKLNSREVE